MTWCSVPLRALASSGDPRQHQRRDDNLGYARRCKGPRNKKMKQELRRRLCPEPSVGLVVLACFILIAYGLPAYGQPSSQNNIPAAVAAPSRCPEVQHWDSGMQMCMPNGDAAKGNESHGPTSQQNATTPESPAPTEIITTSSQCSTEQHWVSSMSMCMAGRGVAKTSLMFHLNQFMLYSDTSGPRGQARLTGPGMWMLMFDKELSPDNQFHINVMGSPEQLTVGDKGTPQLLQTEHVDNMHAHDTIMALEFRDTQTLGIDGNQQLTFLFAPRGEAAIGPVPFMHRASAEGNPDAPLSHARQDGFHDASTVFGIEYKNQGTTIEATGFGGQNISWPFPMHSPDSYGVRVNQGLGDHVGVGASYADALLPNDAGGTDHSRYISNWLTTSHQIHDDSLKSAFVWGQVRGSDGVSLNSFLEEAVFQHGKNRFFGRAEQLQLTPAELDFVPANGNVNAKWVEAFTVGYERVLFQEHELSLLVGESYTQDIVPRQFQPTYGSGPRGFKAYLRLKVDGSSLIGKAN
jgi:hypothetical protein